MILDPFIREREGADGLVEGYYLIQRRMARRVDVPVRIWFGPPLERDDDGKWVEMDRSPRWQINIAGELLEDEPFRFGNVWIDELGDFWPQCATCPIDQADYDYRVERQSWAAQYDPDDPFATPGGRIDPMTARLPFQED